MGPTEFAPGEGLDVLPHPHINLATLTYLFEGAITHRDSLGSHQVIRPGAVNWMHAGPGIVHSERTPPPERAAGSRLHGIQLWVGLPQAEEERAPSFQHTPADAIPETQLEGVALRVLVGAGFGLSSPVHAASQSFCADARLEPGARLSPPCEHPERALYLVEGGLRCGAETYVGPCMLILEPGSLEFVATGRSRLLLLGGEPLVGERFMSWNFASSSRERVAQARRDWQEGRFPQVPGDEDAFVPLPPGSF